MFDANLTCSTIAEEGYPFGVLFSEAASKYNMLCIGLYRVKGADPDDEREADATMRIVLSAPDKNMTLHRDDIAFMLVQFDGDRHSDPPP